MFGSFADGEKFIQVDVYNKFIDSGVRHQSHLFLIEMTQEKLRGLNLNALM